MRKSECLQQYNGIALRRSTTNFNPVRFTASTPCRSKLSQSESAGSDPPSHAPFRYIVGERVYTASDARHASLAGSVAIGRPTHRSHPEPIQRLLRAAVFAMILDERKQLHRRTVRPTGGKSPVNASIDASRRPALCPPVAFLSRSGTTRSNIAASSMNS